MTLTYKVPRSIKTPFTTGETVDVCNRDLETMSQVKVRRAGPRVVTLVDGRQFRATDGWWIGEDRAWPFPSIRHAKTNSRR